MNKFRVGDQVERVHCGCTFSDGRSIDVGDVSFVTDTAGGLVLLEDLGWVDGAFFKLVEPVYPNPPHKHADLIKAWADGAEIECLIDVVGVNAGERWCFMPSPAWGEYSTYRIKPIKSDKDLQIEQLEKQARDLADEISKLKGVVYETTSKL